MVFPPSRKLPEKNLRLDQAASRRREPQVDLSGMGEQVPPEEPGDFRRSDFRRPDAQASQPPPGPFRHGAAPRAQHGPSAAADDDDIPTLTEVVEIDPAGTVEPGRLPAEPDRQETEEVLQRLLHRSDVLQEAQLQQALMPAMERASATIARELHDSLERIVRESVARAVTEELNRLRSENNERDGSPRT